MPEASIRFLILALSILALGCGKKVELEQPKGAWSDTQAKAELTKFLEAYVSGSADDAVALLCDRDSGARAAAAQFIERSQQAGSPFRVDAFALGEMKAAWKGDAPVFDAMVRFQTEKKVDGKAIEIAQRFFVQADPGCIDGLGQGAKHGASSAPAAPPSEQTPPPKVETLPDAPVGADDDVIEL